MALCYKNKKNKKLCTKYLKCLRFEPVFWSNELFYLDLQIIKGEILYPNYQ